MDTPAQAFEEDPAGPQPRVLLVDDDKFSLLLTAAALRDRGLAVVESGHGADALEQLAQWMPDVVVLDAMMPGLDGFETCRRLRRMPGHEHTPVLMLTGLDDDESIAMAYEAGATDFFLKSHQWNLLAGRLRYLLRVAHTRKELESSKAKLARAQDLARMGSLQWHAAERGASGHLELSAEAARVFGLGPGAAPSVRGLLRRVEPGDRRSMLRRLAEVQAHGSVLATDLPITLPDGRLRIVHVEAEPEYSDQGLPRGYTGIVQDVTDRRAAEDKIRHLANYDALTGLPNRRQLIWRTERALEHARQHGHACALLLIDLDRFKLINDNLGHAAGDEALCEVARRLRSCVRHCEQVAESTLESAGARAHRALEAAGRLGGDEFVALLPDVGDPRDAQMVATRILEALRPPMLVAGQECFITASVGIAIYPRDGASVLDLLRNSDSAMYAVKASGRNGVTFYSPERGGRGSREMLALETALHKALEREELVLHYQPKVDARSGRMVGAEALMRWQRDGRLVEPAEFIPAAEESGLIVPMTHWALMEAARQARAWSTAFGFDSAIAVNVPTRLIERADLVEQIHRAVSAQQVPHRAIQLEITETGLMKELAEVMPSLHRLNEVGVEVSVDDFGTGYSSLAYLTSLPISELKIDRKFVRDLGVTPQSSAIVTAIIALARSLGLRVVAEGVETDRQLDVLNRLGCYVMQGFLFARAMPGEAIAPWLEQFRRTHGTPWLARPVAEDAMPRVAAQARAA